MSRAFVKEDVDPPERSGRTRSASGLPPGALNYITAEGAARLRTELDDLRATGAGATERAAELERIIGSLTIVEPSADLNSIAFGARVTLRDAAGELKSYRIVGVDEVRFYSDAVAWVSPVGRTLLAANVGDRVILEGDERLQVIAADHSRN